MGEGLNADFSKMCFFSKNLSCSSLHGGIGRSNVEWSERAKFRQKSQPHYHPKGKLNSQHRRGYEDEDEDDLTREVPRTKILECLSFTNGQLVVVVVVMIVVDKESIFEGFMSYECEKAGKAVVASLKGIMTKRK